MKRLDDGFDKTNNQGDQSESKILEQDRNVGKQKWGAIFPLKGGWTSARRPTSSLKSDLSTIATSARLIIFVGLVAILYFGRPVFVPLAVAILLAFILASYSVHYHCGSPRLSHNFRSRHASGRASDPSRCGFAKVPRHTNEEN